MACDALNELSSSAVVHADIEVELTLINLVELDHVRVI